MKRRGFWRWLGLAALVLFLYVALLLVFAPAEYLARGLAALTQGTVLVQQPSGSLWHGNGTLALARTPNAVQPLGQIRWAIRPWHLLTGSVVIELEFSGQESQAHGVADLGLRHYAVRDLVVAGPVNIITWLRPATRLMGLDGRVRLTSAALELDPSSLSGSADLSWEAASSRLIPVTPLGDYALQLNAQGKRAALRVNTVRGALQVVAEGDWNVFEDGMVRVRGTAAATQPALEPFLNALGPPQADGRRTLNYETKLAPLQPAQLFAF